MRKSYHDNLKELLEYTTKNITKLEPEEIKHQYTENLYRVLNNANTFYRKDLVKYLYSITSQLSLRDIDYVIRLIDTSTDWIVLGQLENMPTKEEITR